MTDKFIIEGGHRLKGDIIPQGAKNEALQVICATLLTKEPVTISNVPNILDVNNLIKLLKKVGVKVRGSKQKDMGNRTYTFQADNLDLEYLASDEFVQKCAQLRGSVMMIGPLLGRYGRATVAKPGGDKIGRRRLDTHFMGFHALGATYTKAKGRNNLLTIVGTDSLKGTEHKLLPDMIEVGSFIAMAAMVGDGIRIKGASIKNLGIIPDTFRRLGITVEEEGDDLYVPKHEKYQIDSFIDGTIMTISDAPWPGLTPDLLSVLLVVATQAEGCVLFHQKMFESRLFFVDKLIDMNAQIILCDPHRAVVIGHNHTRNLRAARMSSPDIRAGIALLIAAMSADGISEISNIAQIDRGYENIEGRLNALGAKIRRE